MIKSLSRLINYNIDDITNILVKLFFILLLIERSASEIHVITLLQNNNVVFFFVSISILSVT